MTLQCTPCPISKEELERKKEIIKLSTYEHMTSFCHFIMVHLTLWSVEVIRSHQKAEVEFKNMCLFMFVLCHEEKRRMD